MILLCSVGRRQLVVRSLSMPDEQPSSRVFFFCSSNCGCSARHCAVMLTNLLSAVVVIFFGECRKTMCRV